MTALMSLAYEQTHLARWSGFLIIAQIGPTVLFGVLGGKIADRFPQRLVIAITQIIFAAVALLLLICYLQNLLTVQMMLVAMLIHGVAQAVDLPTRLALVPRLVHRDDLINAISLNSLMFNASRALGPAIAGILITTIGFSACFVFNFASYLAVLLAISLMRFSHEALPLVDNREFPVAAGVIPTQIKWLIVVAGLVAVSGWPILALLPAYADRVLHGGQELYSQLLSCVGVGALVAALVTASFGNEARRRKILQIGLIFVAFGLLWLCFSKTMVLACFGCMILGFGMILFFSTGQSAVHLSVDQHHRGRVMGWWASVMSAGVPVGNLLFAPIADTLSVPLVIGLQAAMVTVTLGITYLRRIP